MSYVVMNIRMNREVKKQAQDLFANRGINMTAAINLFLQQTVRKGDLPFSVKESKPNKKTLSAIQSVEKGKDLSPVFSSIDDAKEWLNA